MNSKLKEIFNQVHAEEELKYRTKTFISQKTNGYTRTKALNYKPLISAAVCLFLILLGGRWLYFTPTVEISIDINPSIELGINRFDKVISVKSYNNDGQELINSLNIKYINYEEAINQIFNNENISDLLSNDEFMTIGVIGTDGTQSARIFSNIESCTSERRNTSCYFAYPDEVEAAHELGLSYGKYRAFLELQNIDPDITPEEIQGMTMREIKDLIDSLSSDDENSTDEDNNKGYGHYGKGNGYRHGQE